MAHGIDYVGLVPVTATSVPQTWVIVGNAYAIAPDSLSFSPAATISFSIPGQNNTTANSYFIGRYRNGEWVRFPGTTQTTTIAADIDSSGTYALMAYKMENTAGTVTTLSTLSSAHLDTSGTLTPEGMLTIASVVTQEQTTAPAATKKAPLCSLTVLGAIAIGTGIARGKK